MTEIVCPMVASRRVEDRAYGALSTKRVTIKPNMMTQASLPAMIEKPVN
jgi:hypothetical protein